MVMTVFKVYCKKKGPSVIQYRNYKNFSNDKFRNDLLNELIRSKIETLRLEVLVNSMLKVKKLLLKNVILEQKKLLSCIKF